MAADLRALARTTVETPLGPFTIVAGDRGVVATAFAADAASATDDDGRSLDAAAREVREYFAGRLRAFRTPVDLSGLGDGFARRTLEAVRTIPYGELRTYGDVAAAAAALARCPIELFVPCHRVVRAGPSLGSYGGHDERRRFLLALEGSLPGVRTSGDGARPERSRRA